MVFCNMAKNLEIASFKEGHNPYFNRWFSAIPINQDISMVKVLSQSLF